MPQVVLVVQTQHGDLQWPSRNYSDPEAAQWLKKIDAAMSATGLDVIETDWAVVRRLQVVGAYLVP